MHGLFIDRYCLRRGTNLSRSIVRASVTISFSRRSRRDAPWMLGRNGDYGKGYLAHICVNIGKELA